MTRRYERSTPRIASYRERSSTRDPSGSVLVADASGSAASRSGFAWFTSSRPPGRSTRATSARQASFVASSKTNSDEYQEKTASKAPAANGSARRSPRRRSGSAAPPSPSARRRAAHARGQQQRVPAVAAREIEDPIRRAEPEERRDRVRLERRERGRQQVLDRVEVQRAVVGVGPVGGHRAGAIL